MLQLLNMVYAVCTWKSGRLNQIVDVPVSQFEKKRVEANQLLQQERVEANQLVPQKRTQHHINEPNFITWNGILNFYSEENKMLQA